MSQTTEILESLKAFRSDIPKHRYFNPEPGDIEISPWYADNEIHSLELRFSVPADQWNEFRTSPFFRELVSEIRSYHLQTPDTHTDCCEPEYIMENPVCDGNSTVLDRPISIWARVRRLLRKH